MWTPPASPCSVAFEDLKHNLQNQVGFAEVTGVCRASRPEHFCLSLRVVTKAAHNGVVESPSPARSPWQYQPAPESHLGPLGSWPQWAFVIQLPSTIL